MKYRKRQAIIEAEQVTAENGDRVAKWCGGRFDYLRDRGMFDEHKSIQFPTFEGVACAYAGDYIIKSLEGRFRVAKAGHFDAIYERVGKR